MNVMAKVQALPRTAVGVGLDLARLPVIVAARVSGQRDNEEWPPTVAFEGVEASVETVVGSLLRDGELVERGRVRQAKVAQLRKAARLETVAEQNREQADAALAAERKRAQAKRTDAARRGARRKQEVAQQGAAGKQAVDQQAARRAAAVNKAEQAQEQVLDRVERESTDRALAREADALRDTQQALDAADTVTAIDDAIEGNKAARDAG